MAGIRTYMEDKRNEGDTQDAPDSSKRAAKPNDGGDPLGHQFDARIIGGGKRHSRANSANKQDEREYFYNV